MHDHDRKQNNRADKSQEFCRLPIPRRYNSSQSWAERDEARSTVSRFVCESWNLYRARLTFVLSSNDKESTSRSAHNGACDSTAPTLGETKVAVVVNATSGAAEGNAVQVFTNGNAERQLDVQPQLVLCFIDFGILEFQPDMQKPRTVLPIEPLVHYG
jgi:hypothetical protein